MTSRLVVNSVRHTGASADAITLDSSGNVTFPGNATCSGTPSGFGGITMADQWRITSELSVTSFDYITANWERNDSTGYGGIGTGMTESSGEFSFPSTGVYLVRIVINWYASGGGVNYNRVGIYTTTNNSSYSERAFTWSGVESGNQYNNMMAEILFDVTDVSLRKVKFQLGASNTRPRVRGETNYNASYATFIRLGDT